MVVQPRGWAGDAGDETKEKKERTKGITPAKKPVQFLKLLPGQPLESTEIAHNLDLVAILHQVEEYQFASSKSIGTYPSY